MDLMANNSDNCLKINTSGIMKINLKEINETENEIIIYLEGNNKIAIPKNLFWNFYKNISNLQNLKNET